MPEQHIKPPLPGSRFFGKFLLNEEINEKLGDFEEVFRYIAEGRGVFRARLWYWLQIFKTLPACLENIIYWRLIMIKSYLKIALRNITKSKAISFINIFGLSIGIAFFILVFLFVKNEYSHDRFHENHDSIYRVLSESKSAKNHRIGAYTPMRLADDLKRLYPEIEKTVRVSRTTPIIRNDGNSFRETVYYVGKEFFNVFSFPVLKGNMSNPLAEPHSIVISKEMAEKYFKNRDPVGKKLDIEFYDRKRDFYVSAVYDRKAGESSLVFDFLVPFDIYLERFNGKFMMTSYGANGGETYIKLNENTSRQDFNKKLSKIGSHINLDLPQGRSVKYLLQPLTDIHLDNSFSNTLAVVSSPVYSYILSGLGLLVLFIGCINFLTLALGRSASRAKEVGIRKVIGANKSHLAKQYLGEAILISVFALFAAVILASLMLPAFNELAGKAIAFKIDVSFLFAILAITLLVGIAAGSYPAVVLSQFNPVKVLRGGANIKGKNNFSRILVVVQFMLSIFLIITTLTMRKQLNYMTEMNLGFDHERLVEIAMNSSDKVSAQVLQRFKNEIELKNKKMILGVSAAATPYGTDWTRIGVDTVEKEQVKFNFNQVDYDYIKTMGIEIVEGRNFSKEYGSDSKDAVIVNEKFVEQYGIKEPLNKLLPGRFKNKPGIIAVVKNFNFASLHDDIQPLVMALSHDAVAAKYSSLNTPGWPPYLDYIIVRLGRGDLRPVTGFLESTWSKVSPGSPIEINFVDDTINRHYLSEKRWGKIVDYASIFAICIAALGLFGLSMLSMEKRLKEIGIRKVLGAATGRLVVFITKDLLILVAIANIFAWPVAFLALNKWLQNFAYKTGIDLSIFLFTAFLSLLIAGLTISYQTLKAAFLNPIDIIRYE
ncbi:MAG: ABC transporter permease [Candidatus Aminicenantes bacterium]|nr:ABC transporter permease [Candidatus Aminicenantes bacterium]